MRKTAKWMAGLALLGAVVAGGAAWVIAMPGEAVAAPLLADPAEEATLQVQLLRHVSAIAGERNYRRREALEASAQYIEGQLRALGYTVLRQEVPSHTGPVRNIEVRLGSAAGPTAAGNG